MPFHRVPKGHEHEDLAAIRRDGEVIVAVLHDDEAHWAVFTEYPRLTSPLSMSEARLATQGEFSDYFVLKSDDVA